MNTVTTTAGPKRAPALPATALAALIAVIALILPSTAHAASVYRYWGYFHLDKGAWTFAQTGPDGAKPADGAVEGYRYAVGDMTTTHVPRALLTFDAICAATAPKADTKRVGVVIDFGRDADARDAGAQVPTPFAACAQVPTAATGSDILKAVSQVRVEGGLVCGIDGYPATGCSDTLAAVPAAAKAADTPITIAVGSGSATAAASSDAGATDTSPASPATTSAATPTNSASTSAAAESTSSGGVPAGVGWAAGIAILIGAAVMFWRVSQAKSRD